TAPPEIPVEPDQTEEKTAALSWPTPTLPILFISYHVPAGDPRHPDVAALGALAQVEFGETSPLYQDLVLKQQTVVRLGADSAVTRAPVVSRTLEMRPNPADIEAVRGRMFEALEHAATKTVEPARLAEIQSHLRYEYAGSLESANSVALTVAQWLA